MRTSVVALALASVAVLPALPPAEACTTANCSSVTQTPDGATSKGKFKLDVFFRYIDQSRRLQGTSEIADVWGPKVDYASGTVAVGHHRDTEMAHRLLQFDLGYGLTEKLTLAATLPVMTHKEHTRLLYPVGHIHYAGAPEAVVTPRTNQYDGFGDMELQASYLAWSNSTHGLLGKLTVKLPTGPSDAVDPYDGTVDRPEVQPGTGSTDFMAMVQYQRQLPFKLSGSVSGTYRYNTANDLAYRFGNEVWASAGVSRSVWGPVRAGLLLNLREAWRDEFRGVVVPGTGLTYLNVTPNLRINVPGGAALSFFAKIPVYQHVNEQQLAPRFDVLTGISKSF